MNENDRQPRVYCDTESVHIPPLQDRYTHACNMCIFERISIELKDARRKHREFHSLHEAYGVIAEEFHQLQEWIFIDEPDYCGTTQHHNRLREKSIKLAAMAAALVLECL
jgi:hypothetical protein